MSELNEVYKLRAINNAPHLADTIPQFGKPGLTNTINIFARCSLILPGEPTTKALTNPRIIQTFRMSVPNIYTTPWFKNTGYLQTLLNTALQNVESQFPFPTLQANNFNYNVAPESIYYTYIHEGAYLFYRANVIALKLMDPVIREEHLEQAIPCPIPYQSVGGKVYDASYDISFLVCNVKPKALRDAPPNQNEFIFLQELNNLAIQKVDAVGSIARLLTIYHDYRTATLNSQPVQPREKVKFKPLTPDQLHPSQQQALLQGQRQYNNQPFVLHPNAIPPVKQPVPPYIIPQNRKPQAHPSNTQHYSNPHVAQQQWQHQVLQQQQMMDQIQSQMYQNLQENQQGHQPMDVIPATPPPRRNRRKAKPLIDPTTPWDRSYPTGMSQ